ncbi:transmembrane protein 256 homolog [Chelonus insularis]|uniref:transmembrane protein 256 homolog n=1 Tax=Chelonus insularis TaxID=460826 RepID=UPI001589810D|nr:transmembrane protein 256 homolog [Chelonus insularis]
MDQISNALSYVIFTNPISATVGDLVKTSATSIITYSGLTPKVEPKMIPPEPLWKLAASAGPYLRLAGISGASAVILGAYGAHKEFKDEQLKQVFDTANRYHFYHSLAMIGLSLCRKPFLTATLLLSGMVMFSGTCYYYAFTGDRRFSMITPYGGICFILAWLSMCI